MTVFFLAFANSLEHPLAALTKEYDGLNKILNAANKGLFHVDPLEFSTLERVNERLGNYADRLALFHFSGHAGHDALLLNDAQAQADGIAYQLGESAAKGILKLVVLNGCSTKGQVRKLLEVGVPAVVATHAAVGDISASEFSLRFFQNMAQRRMTIRAAFRDALGPALTVNTEVGDPSKPARGLGYLNAMKEDAVLWELFYRNDADIDINPVPVRRIPAQPDFIPNENLTKTIFESLHSAGNIEINELWEKEKTAIVSESKKQKAFLEILPFPVTAHLQKLLSADQGDDGYDKIGLRRLQQIGTVYQIVMEFLGYIMISQLWELKLTKVIVQLPPAIIIILRNYYYLKAEARAVFDYLSFIRTLRLYFDTLNEGRGVKFFVEELEILKELSQDGQVFADACSYLTYIHRQTTPPHSIPDQEVPQLCMEAEIMLCRFFEKLGFLHRYTLTSIQKINILKYRHDMTAKFNHQVVRLKDAFGTPEVNYYLMSTFLDNTGVILTKQNLELLNPKKKIWTLKEGNLAYLNLSSFVIDRNSFEERTDCSNLMFFQQYQQEGQVYSFKNVRRPDSELDVLEVLAEEKYEAVRLQFKAFSDMILNEPV